MNISSLNSLVSNIKNVDSNMDKTDITPIIAYCVKKHNESIDALKEVHDFVEKNFDIFENPRGGWLGSRNQEYHTNYNIGNPNLYNCVIRDFHHEQYLGKDENTRIYWVDEGIIFLWNANTNKVIFLTDCDETRTHGYGNTARNWNDSLDFRSFNVLGIDRYSSNGNYRTNGPDFEALKWSVENLVGKYNEFNIKKLKDGVDADAGHIELIVNRLVTTLTKINESVIARQKTMNEMIDGSSVAKTTKYVIEINKIED